MSGKSQQGRAPVTVDTRALIDKVLARYSGEFTVFRELLQNSDDAGCDAAEIRFETAAFLGLDSTRAVKANLSIPPDLKTANVVQWTFKNRGKPFTSNDWGRLPKIALGNPDPQKVGAFGVGFYSLFSVTESPYVSSGDKEMEFSWNDQDELYYRFGDLPKTVTPDLWTTFKMPLREASPMPPVSEFMKFLASSITFMVHLKDVASQVIAIPMELKRSSPEKHLMVVKSVHRYPITITAKITPPRRDSMRMNESKVDLTVFTAEVDVSVDEKLSKELSRCTKKNPPSRLEYSLIYTEKDKYDQSRSKEQKHPPEFPSVFQGLCADLDGAKHPRIFIGHATAQTTGIGGHMASYFIPTVERESIDLADKNVSVWNRELLYVGGFLCRVVYELELSKIRSSWEEAAAGSPHSRPSPKLQDQFHERFLHVFKFFTFHHSTPSSKVAHFLSHSFHGCSTLPLKLLSSVGVRGAPDVRAFDPVFAKFLKSLPMLSEYVTQHGAQSVAALPDHHKIPTITLSDVLQGLRDYTLDDEELVSCLRWWITSKWNVRGSDTADLFAATTFYGTGGARRRLSSITSFVDPKGLGLHIPPDGPLPPSLVPLDISKHFVREELTGIGWVEFAVDSWLQHISHPDVISADKKYDFTRSVNWATCVLGTLCRVWPELPDHSRSESREVFKNKPCIPTSKGLCCPQCSYLPIADDSLFHRLDVPIVGNDSGFKVDEVMKRFLLFIGVRNNLPVQILLHQMLSTGDWTVFNLVDYLVQRELSFTPEDLSALKSSKIFMRESLQNNKGENTRHRADELYPPLNIFRRLQLPVIDWSAKSEWSDTSPEAELLYRLGLNHFPPLPKIIELCSSRDVGVQETAFGYLCSQLHSQYPDYKPENFLDVEFIPAESEGCICLKKLGEVYSGIQWRALGFFVVQDRYRNAPLHRLGVNQYPPTLKLMDLLQTTPPPDIETAGHWFEVLFDHIASFSPSDFIKLSELPIVPTGQSGAPKLLPPTKCYLDQGTKANSFLGACGAKNKVSVEDVAEVLIENPERLFELAGGYEGFLVELRKFAYQRQDISNATLHKMSYKPALVGVRQKKTEGQAGWDYEHRFLTYEGVVIVDDIDEYQLFSDSLFVAPREEELERFYASLGCSYLSAVVKERCDDLHEIPDASGKDDKTCSEVQSLILERLPLFIQKYTDTKPKVSIPSILDHLKVKACKRIRVSKTLMPGNVKRTRDVWAIARHESASIELWLSKTAKRDMYEVATSLCRVLFGTTKINATLLLETILSADLEVLERRGFAVDHIPQKHRDGYGVGNKTRKMHSAGSALTANYPQQTTLDVQANPQLNREELPGSHEATPQIPSLPHVLDNVLTENREGSHLSSDNSLNTVRHSTFLPVSRTLREVIPQSFIRNNVENAIQACGSGGVKSSVHAGVNELFSSGFCRVSADVRSLRLVGEVKSIQVYVDDGVPDADTFMKRMNGPLARFVDIIVPLCEIYHIPTTTLRVFYDVSGGCIAFNSRGTLYLNLRYFEAWHDEQVQSGNPQSAQMSWFLALAHEIAHNLTDRHNADHEFWFSAICEAHLVAFSQLLRSANSWRRYVLWLRLIVIVALFVYFAKCMAPVTNILH